MGMNCEGTREHLDSCEDCRLHVAVEARLRTQPVLEPPERLADRVMRRLPGARPAILEFRRLAAAAAVLIALVAGLAAFGVDRHETVAEVAETTKRVIRAVPVPWDALRSETWKP